MVTAAANADGHIHANSIGWRKRGLLEALPDPLRDDDRFSGFGFREKHDELFSTITVGGVNSPDTFPDDIRQSGQYPVTVDMAVGVVEYLEIINIKQNQREWRCIAVATLDLLSGAAEKVA